MKMDNIFGRTIEFSEPHYQFVQAYLHWSLQCSAVRIFREESDTFGPIKVEKSKLWAAQTQRSLQNFNIARDTDTMPKPIIHAFGILKKCAAKANLKYGLD